VDAPLGQLGDDRSPISRIRPDCTQFGGRAPQRPDLLGRVFGELDYPQLAAIGVQLVYQMRCDLNLPTIEEELAWRARLRWRWWKGWKDVRWRGRAWKRFRRAWLFRHLPMSINLSLRHFHGVTVELRICKEPSS